ncbi:MAG: hypothetical protein JW934_23710 [Anaerolineae bacterium]|nr:hypothetical protein [Anaerolineae bacterium]
MALKNVLVLSDDDLLSQVIELTLDEYVLQVIPIPTGSSECQTAGPDLTDIDLVILALGSLNSEPVVALAKTSLTNVIGQIPLLIISSKRFQPDTSVSISHLDFPFDVRELQVQVRKALRQRDVVHAS